MSISREFKDRMPLALCIIAVAAGGLAVGCSAGSGEGLDISGRPIAEGGDVALAPTLASIQANVFNPFCVVCHAGASAPLGLRLDAASSYTNLVSVRSVQNSSLFRVMPGDPGQSYLVRKLEGTATEGAQMPLGGPPVPQSTIDFVRQWITDGALPEDQAPGGGPPVVTSFSLAPGSSLASLPADITAGFNQDIDASTVNAQTFTLLRSADGQFGNGDDIAVQASSVGLSPGNPRLAIMDHAGTPSVDDLYRVTLHGSGPNLILAVNGEALDGDFVVDFEVEGLQPSLDSIQANVFTPICAVCHNGVGSILPGSMDLSSAAASFAALVNSASIQRPALDRVEPGQSDASYLVQKLEGDPSIDGTQMPQGGPFLDQATIDVVRLWIDDGAMQ